MNTASKPKKLSGGIDPAALAGAAIAAAVSSIGQPGAYNLSSTIIGITILVLIIAYDVEPNRTTAQSGAFSAVIALVAVLAVGLLLEIFLNEDKNLALTDLIGGGPKSSISPIWLGGVWLTIWIICFAVDVRGQRKNAVVESM